MIKISQIHAPVIVIGMHRSGTSVLSRLLSMLGVNMGLRVDDNWESNHTRRINQFIFRQINATWDHVTPFNNLYKSNDHVRQLELLMRSSINRRFILDHFGLSDSIAIKPKSGKTWFWGWKDPRNTFTLPFWKAIFPAAKIIHIYRNPVDVGLSLKTREELTGVDYENNYKTRFKKIIRYGRIGMSNVNMLDAENGCRLWEQYVSQALEHEKTYGNDVLSICYEELLADVTSAINIVSAFLEINNPDTYSSQINAAVKSDNRYKFINSDEGMRIYLAWRENTLFRQLGYPLRLKHVI